MMAKLNPIIDLIHAFSIPCLLKVNSIDTDRTSCRVQLKAHDLGVFEYSPEGDELIIGPGSSFASCFFAVLR